MMIRSALTLITSCLIVTRVTAATVGLSSTWGEFDWNQTNPVLSNSGNLALSGQSSSGFTAAVGPNALDVDGSAGIDSTGRPRIYQTFAPQTLAALGDTVSLTFSATIANAMVNGDSQFRFAFADTARNQGIWASTDFGTAGGNTTTTRFDPSITDPNVSASYVAGNWGSFLNSGTTRGNSGGVPNGTSLGDAATLATVHNFSLLVTRVAGGLSWTYTWGNNAGPAVETVTIGSVFDDSIIQTNGANAPMTVVDGIAFNLWNDAPFGAGNTGSFTISNVVVNGVNAVPEPSAAGLLLLGLALAGRRRK